MACLELPSQSPRSNCENAEKGKSASGPPSTARAARRWASRASSPPSSSEVRDLVPVGVDSGSSSCWWKRDRQEARGPSPKTLFSYSVYLLDSARHAPSMEAHRASVVAIRPAARKRTRKGYLRLNNSCFIIILCSLLDGAIPIFNQSP